MSVRQGMQALRITGFGLAVIAAVVVFVVGGVTEAEAWRTPALILIGVLVVVLHFSTLPYLDSSVSTEERIEYRVEYASAPGAPVGVMPPAPCGPVPVGQAGAGASAPTAADSAAFGPSAAGTVLPGVVIPTHAFPDAGRGHAPAMEARTAEELPPLRHVLGSDATNSPPQTSSPPAGPAPEHQGASTVTAGSWRPVSASGAVASSGGSEGVRPDAVLVDLRSSDDEAHLVYQVIDGTPSDPAAPATEPASSAAPMSEPAAPPGDPGPPHGAPPHGVAPPGIVGPVDPRWGPPDPGTRRA